MSTVKLPGIIMSQLQRFDYKKHTNNRFAECKPPGRNNNVVSVCWCSFWIHTKRWSFKIYRSALRNRRFFTSSSVTPGITLRFNLTDCALVFCSLETYNVAISTGEHFINIYLFYTQYSDKKYATKENQIRLSEGIDIYSPFSCRSLSTKNGLNVMFRETYYDFSVFTFPQVCYIVFFVRSCRNGQLTCPLYQTCSKVGMNAEMKTQFVDQLTDRNWMKNRIIV